MSPESYRFRHLLWKKLTSWLPYCKMTDLHLDHFLYLCTQYYQSRGLPIAQEPWKVVLHKTVRWRALHSHIQCDLDKSCYFLHKSRDRFRPIFISRIPKCTEGTLPDSRGLLSPHLWASTHFLTTRLHGGYNPDDDSSFSRPKNRSFSIILFCTYYALKLTTT